MSSSRVVYLVRKAANGHAIGYEGFAIFDSLDDAITYFDKHSNQYGGYSIKPVIEEYVIGIPCGRKVLKAERVVVQKRLGLKEI